MFLYKFLEFKKFLKIYEIGYYICLQNILPWKQHGNKSVNDWKYLWMIF